MKYLFESEYFALSEDGFHLLRSKFNFRTHAFSEIQALTIEKGKLVNNWLAILVFGLAAIGFSIFYSLRMYQLLNSDQITRIYVEELVVPIIPLLLGVYCIFHSLRHGPTLLITFSNSKTKRYPLDKETEQNLNGLYALLKSNNALKAKSTILI